MHVDPVSTLTLAKTATDLMTKLFEFAKKTKSAEEKQEISEILDKVLELKQSATLLEDENRDLREKLRFKSDDFEWKRYYYVEKRHPDRPLCPKCYIKEKIGHLGDEMRSGGLAPFRICTACKELTDVGPPAARTQTPETYYPEF